MSWFIPPEYFSLIKDSCYMDPHTEEWVVSNAHLAGNATRQMMDAEEAARTESIARETSTPETPAYFR